MVTLPVNVSTMLLTIVLVLLSVLLVLMRRAEATGCGAGEELVGDCEKFDKLDEPLYRSSQFHPGRHLGGSVVVKSVMLMLMMTTMLTMTMALHREAAATHPAHVAESVGPEEGLLAQAYLTARVRATQAPAR